MGGIITSLPGISCLYYWNVAFSLGLEWLTSFENTVFLGPLDPSGAAERRPILPGQSGWWGRLPRGVKSLGHIHAGWRGARDQLSSTDQSDHARQPDQPFLLQPGRPGEWPCLFSPAMCFVEWAGGVTGETNPAWNYLASGSPPWWGPQSIWLIVGAQ